MTPDQRHTGTWLACNLDHEVRVLRLADDTVALQVRVSGALTTTTLLGPQARLALAGALTDV